MLSIYQLLDTYRYSEEDGRTILEGLARNLATSGHPEIVADCERAIELVVASHEADVAAATAPSEPPSQRVPLAAETLRLNNVLIQRLQAESALGEASPLSRPAAELLAAGWPRGTTRMGRSGHRERALLADSLLRVITQDRWQSLLTDLRLQPTVDALRNTLASFDLALNTTSSWAPVSARPARERANEALMQVVCRIVGAYSTEDTTQVKERDRVLDPLVRTNLAIHTRLAAEASERYRKACEKRAAEAAAKAKEAQPAK